MSRLSLQPSHRSFGQVPLLTISPELTAAIMSRARSVARDALRWRRRITPKDDVNGDGSNVTYPLGCTGCADGFMSLPSRYSNWQCRSRFARESGRPGTKLAKTKGFSPLDRSTPARKTPEFETFAWPCQARVGGAREAESARTRAGPGSSGGPSLCGRGSNDVASRNWSAGEDTKS